MPAADVSVIIPNKVVRTHLASSVPLVHPQGLVRSGYTGKGRIDVIVDTGLTPTTQSSATTSRRKTRA
ncbi:MAG: hypothetical protein U0531_04295 [Dehalococcoidia bacterium]